MTSTISTVRSQVFAACRRLLNEQTRDVYMPSFGCFDRRYWGWKLVDYPEATFQRAVYPLAWLLKQADNPFPPELLEQAILAGLLFSVRIQHQDGSFDQAFPNEHSFGATAFLLHPLLIAFETIRANCSTEQQNEIKRCLRRAADFLSNYEERHGHIANHLAGGALSLLVASRFFEEPKYAARAAEIVADILKHGSSEGWFLEYEGADPGYQTLCMYYLAQVDAVDSSIAGLSNALDQTVSFLQWFVHPDGTFAGEYGSRRTAVYYAGGVALLAHRSPVAHRMTQLMLLSIAQQTTLDASSVDIGNLVPLTSSLLPVLDHPISMESSSTKLPFEQSEVQVDFPIAGLHIRGTQNYYAIFSTKSGGVLKVFDRRSNRIIWNDGGYVGQLPNGALVTSQATAEPLAVVMSTVNIELQIPFYYMTHISNTPAKAVLMRLLNLTFMQNIRLGNFVKRLLVKLLITGRQPFPLNLTRTVHFNVDRVLVTDRLIPDEPLRLKSLRCGIPFVSIHMASARYLDASATIDERNAHPVDTSILAQGHTVESSYIVT